MKKMSLIYAEGVHESRGRFGGLFLGNSDGLFFGRYGGGNESRLSKMAAPPNKLPYGAPAILWLLGFFVVMAFDGRGKLSEAMGLFSVAYLCLLPAILAGLLAYNFFVYARKHRDWKSKFMCQHCGAVATRLY